MSGYIYKEGFFRRSVRKKRKRQRAQKRQKHQSFCLFCALCLFCFPLLFIAVLIMSADSMRMNSSLSESLIASRQLVLVTTDGWDAVGGEMRRYERDTIKDQWKAVGEKIPVVVGRNGMAWGKGLHGDAIGDGPVKKEGDGRSPAGIFSLGSAFGYAPRGQA